MYNTVSTRKRTRESNDKTDLLHVLKMLDNSPHKKSRSDSPENFFYAPPSVVYAKENHLYFRSPVNDQSVSDLVNLIEDKNEEFKELSQNKMFSKVEPSPLYLHITSNGGSVFAGNRAIDAIKNSQMPIYTVAEGNVASMGASMLICGKKRFMTKSSYVLIHQISAGGSGTFHELCDTHQNHKQIMQDCVNHYIEHTLMDEKQIKKEFKHDLWWDYTRCKRNGLVDELY